jgi:bifunctional non-homologous end joining protein LigD
LAHRINRFSTEVDPGSKRRSSPYRSGKCDSWRKAKCTVTEHFAVIGAAPVRGEVRSLRLVSLGI